MTTMLPDYAKAKYPAEVVGITNESLYGSPTTDAHTYIGGYQDTHPEARKNSDGWTSAVVLQVGTRQHQSEHIIRDPDLLVAMASQLLTASIRLRSILENESQ
jgi:hypothetical protein